MRVWPGQPYPLGATWDGQGVNFALFSEHAAAVDLCLFDSVDATVETNRIPLPEYTDHVWHGYFPDIRPGQLYGYRVRGVFDPAQGFRFNDQKLLFDPYARRVARAGHYCSALLGSDPTHGQPEPLSFIDSAPNAPLAQVYENRFDWQGDRIPRTPWHRTIVYETHVKGLTQLHPKIAPELRGSFLGVCSDPVIEHFQALGVTAVELMPVHFFCDERKVAERGMRNYWGYNTLGYFAPDPRYGSRFPGADPVAEFKTMVKTLHGAGIEVILDVVYNHTAEGDETGPTLSFRGIDNASYYRLRRDNPARYLDFTGCGNTLNMMHPRVLQLIMDSLRYWATEMHVDGFRFDLASALARELHEVDRLGSFFDVIHQDPVVSQVKLIAEPWDLGEGGYQVGNFPVLWTEWNAMYRDSVRSFWRGDRFQSGQFATRLSGSSDLYNKNGKSPHASINFVTAHDGFTLQDLVSYERKHNDENGEQNRDGTDDNRSWNCGVEGPSSSPDITAAREQQKRNLMATLMLSLGVPMMSGGDELSRTQRGNNNRYCHDDEGDYYQWELNDTQQAFLDFTRRLIAIRSGQPALQRRSFFSGAISSQSGVKDIRWFNRVGSELQEYDWHNGSEKLVIVCISGESINETDEFGQRISGDTLLAVFNASGERVEVVLPEYRGRTTWELLLGTASAEPIDLLLSSGDSYYAQAASVTLFRCTAVEPER